MKHSSHPALNELLATDYRDILFVAEAEPFLIYSARNTVDNTPVLIKTPGSFNPSVQTIRQLEHEYNIAAKLSPQCALKVIKLEQTTAQAALIMEADDFTPLVTAIDCPVSIERFLQIAITATTALAVLHSNALVHKDIRPEHLFISPLDQVLLSGFGLTCQLPHEHQFPVSPEELAGGLAYMAPERSGRMNRSIDTRSDLYSLGMVFYWMLTGKLPFNATEPLEWIHCHIAILPKSPKEQLSSVPLPLSELVMKLLAKAAEQRYQTADGLKKDLQHCLQQWQEKGTINLFELGSMDTPSHLLIPEKLYGREDEINQLQAAIKRIIAGGNAELLLVKGYSGVGKSALINELNRELVIPQTLFASGKFEQFKRDTPYAPFAQILQSLLQQILTKPETEIEQWRKTINQAVQPNGQLIIDLVPDWSKLIGVQSALKEVSPQDAQNRFNHVMQCLIKELAQHQHPLVIFFDDLQWSDTASLQLIQYLLSLSELNYLLVLGAYRDNEVGLKHPLKQTIEMLRNTKTPVLEIILQPLQIDDICQLIADALHNDKQQVLPLAKLVLELSGGNPFFVTQLLKSLAEDGLVAHNPQTGYWNWDLDAILDKGYSDNVIDLMLDKLKTMPDATRLALKQLACMGNSAEIASLSSVFKYTKEKLHKVLWDAVQSGLIYRIKSTYYFLHDRVYEACYALFPKENLVQTHLAIGRQLISMSPPEKLDEMLFDVVNHFNKGSQLISAPAEIEQVARLNVKAGKKACDAIAYANAANFFSSASRLLGDKAWVKHYDFLFQLYCDRARAEFMNANYPQSEMLFKTLLHRAACDFDRARVHRLRLKLYPIAGKFDEALDAGIEGLGILGQSVPDNETQIQQAVAKEASTLKNCLKLQAISDIPKAAEVSDSRARLMIELLTDVAGPAYIFRPALYPLFAYLNLNLVLQYGVSKEASHALSAYAVLEASSMGNLKTAYESSQAAIELSERFAEPGAMGTVLYLHGNHVNFWLKPFHSDFSILHRSFKACLDGGNLAFANYTAYSIVWQAVERGDTLDEVLAFSQQYAHFAQETGNDPIYHSIILEQQFIRCLQDNTETDSSFSDKRIDETSSVKRIEKAAFLPGLAYYHILKMLACYLSGDNTQALSHVLKARKLRPTVLSQPMQEMFHFLEALILIRDARENAKNLDKNLKKTLKEHEQALQYWADNNPINFACKQALVAAEIAVLQHDFITAEQLFERAFETAKSSNFIHWQAMACEAASQFYLQRGLQTNAQAYLAKARDCYVGWKAHSKVRQLESKHPWLKQRQNHYQKSLNSQLDMSTLFEASQALLAEVELSGLIKALMTITLKNAGADRGLLLLEKDSGFEVKVEAIANEDGIQVNQCHTPFSQISCAKSIINKVINSHKSVLIDNTIHPGDYYNDEYFQKPLAWSINCIPLLRQDTLAGVLYLENRQAPGVFTQTRNMVLDVIAAEAAISLENAQLYDNLKNSEANFRTLVQKIQAAVVVHGADTKILTANLMAQDILGLSEQQLLGKTSIDPGWHFLREDGTQMPIEEYPVNRVLNTLEPLQNYIVGINRPDRNEPVWTLVGAIPVLDKTGKVSQVVISFNDISKKRKAEQQLIANEQLFRTLVENSPNHIARYDLQLRRVYINPTLAKQFKIPRDKALGKTSMFKSPLLDPESYMANMRKVIETGQEVSDEIAFRNFENKIGWADTRFAPEFDANGKVQSVIVISNETTERKKNEDQLRLAGSVFSNSQEGILISDVNNNIIDINPAFTRLTGYKREEVLGKNPNFLSSGKQDRKFYREMWAEIQKYGKWRGEIWNKRKSGEEYAELLSVVAVKDASGKLQHYVGAFSDITVLKQHEADLDHIAHYDLLTSLPNRRLFDDRLKQAIAHASRLAKNLAICYLDLDGFKPINDLHGHEAGDQVLVEIAQRLLKVSRSDDTVARLGGDEFVLLWNDIGNESNCIQALERVLETVSKPLLFNGLSLMVSASIGVTLFPDDDVDADTLLRHADHAMYSAKQLGKNRYQMFDARLERQANARINFLEKVTHALEHDLFELYYQPKVNCETGTIDGVEALIRLNDPVLGLLTPKEFLPLIENDNMALQVGRWVMNKSIQQARNWNSKGITIPISINVFPKHIKHRTFIEDLCRATELHWPDMPKNRLQLEIVETSALDNLEQIEQVISKCHGMGYKFSLDDFGTGYSSLVYLQRLSVDELKIDQSFVRDMLEDSADQNIVISVIGLGQAFGIQVVAEGVETTQHISCLKTLGGTLAQGFAFAKPMIVKDFEEWYYDFIKHGV